MRRRTTVILDRVMMIYQSLAQGSPPGLRAHPQRNIIAGALDRVALVRTSGILDRMIMFGPP